MRTIDTSRPRRRSRDPRATLGRLSSSLLAIAIACAVLSGARLGATSTLPSRLTDQEFWRIVTESSEPGGYFQSDNFVSNETSFQTVIPELTRLTSPDNVYVGVGPEQNFTYIVATRPRLAFIVDIRRQNLIEHLMYKAAFELSADRSEFLGRLFSRRLVAPLDPHAGVKDLFEAYFNARLDRSLYMSNLHAMVDVLTKRHAFVLSTDDLEQLAYVYNMFYVGGPAVQYSTPGSGGRGFGRSMPNYADLMLAYDGHGVDRSYLATEQNFAAMKAFERDNRLIPVVGDFAGAKALRAVGQYVKSHDAIVNALYTSNVEQYLFQNPDNWKKFYANVEALPQDATSTFIRSCFQGCGAGSGAVANPFQRGGSFRVASGGTIPSVSLLEPFSDLRTALREGKIQGYYDVIARSK